MGDIELKKRFSTLYKPSAKTPALIDVPPLRFLMIDGVGDVGGASFQAAIGTLYGLAYPVKFEARKRLDISYPVMPLEGLYHDESGALEYSVTNTATLAWRLMILLPDEVSAEFVDEVRMRVAAKKSLPRLDEVRVQTFTEGLSVQVMHIGPYAEEPATIERLRAFAAQKNVEITGDHHEIYLGDPRRADPAKLKTVLRYGVTRR